jgi:hypothetical protein
MDTARIALSALVVTFVALTACSASKGSGVSEIVSEDLDATADATRVTDSSQIDANVLPKDASVPEAATGECSSEATSTSCVSCCSKAHQDGAGAYLVATIDCMCLPANCAKECAATICNADNPKNPDAACSTCVTAKQNACAQSIKSACTADPACVEFDACVGASECTTKKN